MKLPQSVELKYPGVSELVDEPVAPVADHTGGASQKSRASSSLAARTWNRDMSAAPFGPILKVVVRVHNLRWVFRGPISYVTVFDFAWKLA